MKRFAGTACVFFDLDGTLVDTAADLGAAANHVRATLGLPPLPLHDYRPKASAGARGLLRTALGITPEHDGFAAHRETFLAHYAENLARNSRLFDGMDETLRAMEARGVHWGVVTNKPSRYTEPLLAQLQLLPRLATVVSADEVASPKPAPDSLLLACERVGVRAGQAIYVGDDKRDVDAARSAGMPCVAAGWGYEGDTPIDTWNADVLIHSPVELLGLL